MEQVKHALMEKQSCLRIGRDGITDSHITMIHESTIELRVNGRFILRTQCLASDLEQMAAGFLVCEGILRSREELHAVEADISTGVVNVIAEIPEERIDHAQGHARLTAGGGRMAVIDLLEEKLKFAPQLSSRITITAEELLRLFNAFDASGALYRESRFVHAAALSDKGRLLCFFDDVGRHNAIDKALGYGFLNGICFGDSLLLCSGRFSLEMVSKAASVGLPVFVSPAAPSVEAVQLAGRIGMTLCGRATHDSANVYSASWRIIGP